MSREFRTTCAVLLAPLAVIPAVFAFVFFLNPGYVLDVVFGLAEFDGFGEITTLFLALTSVFGVFIAYLVTLYIGLPIHILLVRGNIHTYRRCSIVGSVLGFVLGFAFFRDPASAALSAFYGLAVALSFRAIAGHQPGKDDNHLHAAT